MGMFKMPSLGADMDSGTVIEWLVQPGSKVERGDIVAVVRTDKADVEVEVFETGVIGEMLVDEGVRVDVGTPLATVLTPAAPDAEPHGAAPPPEPAAAAPAPPAEAPAPVVSPAGGRPRVTPRARRLAAEAGIDVGTLTSPPAHVLTGDDVRAASPGTAANEDSDRSLAMRRAIGALMARSKREIPHYYLQHRIEMAHPLAWLARRNEERTVAERVLPAALLCKATALAARAHPEMNGFWTDGAHASPGIVHLGVAISLRGGGLLAPAIHDADSLSLDDLMAALRDLTARARTGRLRGSEMTDPTITVTNLGEQGIDSVFGAIYPPQVAIVGFGRISEQPWADDGRIGARPVVSATLSADHRASDGHSGARFLGTIDRLLHRPEEL